MYLVASVIFCAGTVFFWPGIYSSDDQALWGQETGAWFFIFGSAGFVLASYWNALGIATDYSPTHVANSKEARAYRFAAIGLCFTMIGSICFLTGSVLYRPAYSNLCDDPTMSSA